MTKQGQLGARAIVVGGSMAGLLAARAVSSHFDEVVVIERDALDDDAGPRRSTPQAQHVHVLLKGGENAIDRLLPGFREDIEHGGSVRLRAGLDTLAASELGVAPRWDAEMTLHGQSRWMLERQLRQRARAEIPNLVLRTECTVRGLVYDEAADAVTGVRYDGPDGSAELSGELIVDACGRGEGGVRWLTALGLPLPEIEEVKVDFAYASARVELARDVERDWKALAVGNLPRDGARGGVLMPMEGGLYMCSLGGRAGDYPPADEAGFIAFAESLPYPALGEALAGARFASPIARMIYPANRFRHYERMERLPAGFVPVGDALCSFNPTYGQGMTSAALQAEQLAATLDEREPAATLRALGPRYLARAAEAARMPWLQANYNDFLYPTTEGDRASLFSDADMAYRTRLQMAAQYDAHVRKLAHDVSQLLLPFERLLEDDVRERVDAALAGSAAAG